MVIEPAPFVSKPTPTPNMLASMRKQKGAVGSLARSVREWISHREGSAHTCIGRTDRQTFKNTDHGGRQELAQMIKGIIVTQKLEGRLLRVPTPASSLEGGDPFHQPTFRADESAVVEGRVETPLCGQLRAHCPKTPARWEELHGEHPTIHFLCRTLRLMRHQARPKEIVDERPRAESSMVPRIPDILQDLLLLLTKRSERWATLLAYRCLQKRATDVVDAVADARQNTAS